MADLNPFKMLCSYAYFRRRNMAELEQDISEHAGRSVMTFGDSGAHSAKTLGLSLTIPEYAAWCRKWDQALTVYSNLDVIGAPRATWDNQQRLEQEYGLRPIPVFHTGEDWAWLERYLDAGYTYIALGALLGNPVDLVMPWVAKAFRIAGDRAVFHGFGMTVWPCISRFPFYSVDSSTWLASVRYGQVKLFDQGRVFNIYLRRKESLLRYREVLRDGYGIDPSVLASVATYDGPTVSGLCAMTWRKEETFLRAVHGPVQLPRGPHDPVRRREGVEAPAGLHVYLASASATELRRGAGGVSRAHAAGIRA